MRKVALVTYKNQPYLNSSDKLLIEPFKKHGFQTFPIPWDDNNVSWEIFDLVVLRTSWNYHLQITEFTNWLNILKSKKIRLWNPNKIIKWNMDKSYLLDLAEKNIPIIPTLLFDQSSIKNINKIISEHKWEEIILKPSFGASSYNIAKLTINQINTQIDHIKKILANGKLLVQPFMKEVITDGEYSFIFFDKKFSHAIHKTPKQNEFRTQPEFGAKEVVFKPNPQYVSQTQKILKTIDSPLLYARVDGLIIDQQFYLMELELIEPYLYFEKNAESAEKFVKSAMELSNKFQPS